MTPAPRVVTLAAPDTHALRRSVLRVGTPTTDVHFAEDELDGTVHLGVVLDDTVVAVSTWVPRCHPDHPSLSGVQVRGMATDPAHRGSGLGGMLLEVGVERAAESGIALVWARARDAALAFYLGHGFEVFGRGYTDLATDLPHHDVVRLLDRRPATRATAVDGTI